MWGTWNVEQDEDDQNKVARSPKINDKERMPKRIFQGRAGGRMPK